VGVVLVNDMGAGWEEDRRSITSGIIVACVFC
jgi:hypothetical protein